MADVVRWYRDMAPIWSAAQPVVRRQLLLCVHRWVFERVLLPLSHGEEPAVEDLRPTGRLVWALIGTVPPGEDEAWKTWIQLVVADLHRALAWPPDRRTESWARSLFQIPRDIPSHRSSSGGERGLGRVGGGRSAVTASRDRWPRRARQ